MAAEQTGASEREQLLDHVLGAYLAAVDTGESPDRYSLLARHPDLATELLEFFVEQDKLDRWTEPLRPAVQAAGAAAIDTPKSDRTSDPADTCLPEESLRSFGDYELLQEIGRGGMGVVYKARQKSLNRLVALKMIRAGSLACAADVQRFQAEAEAAASLDHPHIVPIYQVGEWRAWDVSPPVPYFSMKLVSGGSLADQLSAFQHDPRAAARLLITIAQAVHHAHQRKQFPSQPTILSVAFSPDSSLLITASADKKIRFWDVATGEPTGPVFTQKEDVQALAFSPDGQWLAMASGPKAYVCDVRTGRIIGPVLRHHDMVETVAFSADGRMLLTTSFDGTAHRWDRDTGKPTGRGFQTRNRVHGGCRFSTDSRTVLIVEGNGKAQLGDVITGQRLGPPFRHVGRTTLVAFAPNGRTVLLRDADKRTLRRWRVPGPVDGDAERIICLTETITGMALDAEGMAHALDVASWQKRRLRLDQLGGPPEEK